MSVYIRPHIAEHPQIQGRASGVFKCLEDNFFKRLVDGGAGFGL